MVLGFVLFIGISVLEKNYIRHENSNNYIRQNISPAQLQLKYNFTIFSIHKETFKMKIISSRKNREYRDIAIAFLQKSWPGVSPRIYEDCISNSIDAKNPLPQWYLLEKEEKIIGCAGLITNDFISRMDLYPWVCAIYIDELHRGNAYGSLLLNQAKQDATEAGFDNLYLCTDHVGYYEKYGYKYVAQGYHPWNEESRIYEIDL